MLLPPRIQGPVTTLSPTVRVLGATDGSTVQLLANGAPLGPAVPAGLLATDIPVAGLAAGTLLAATQSRAGASSAPTPVPEPVAAAPAAGALPPPVVLSGVHPCIDWVMVGGAIPGAELRVRHGGQDVGSAVAGGAVAAIPVAFPAGAAAGDVLEVRQEVGGAAGPPSRSLPFGDFARGEPPALALSPPQECDAAVLVTGLAEGLSLIVEQDGQAVEGYPFMGSPVWAGLLRPVRPGETLRARQRTRGCGADGPWSAPVGVSPAPRLPTPRILGPVCPNAPAVRVQDLRPGAEVSLHVVRTQSPGSSSGALIGTVRAWDPDCEFLLPPDWSDHPAAAGPGLLSITASQANCDRGSDAGRQGVAPLPGLVGTPTLAPLVECARLVAVRQATPGALLRVMGDQADWPVLSAPTLAHAPDQAIPLHRPLRKGERVRVEQTGCGAAAASAPQMVAALAALPAPRVAEPLRIPHGVVRLEGLVTGARVHLFVSGAWRASADATGPEMAVLLAGLDVEAPVSARQALCSALSDESPRVSPRWGELALEVSPQGPITRGQPTAITVTARDRDNGAPVAGQVVIGGAVVGALGAPFTHSFGAGAAPASRATAPLYDAAPIQWTLRDPPPAPVRRLNASITNAATAHYDLGAVTWRLERQEPGGTLSPVATATGPAWSMTPPGNAQYHLSAEVAVTDKATGESLFAEFRGNGTFSGRPTMVFAWTGAASLSYGFSLRAISTWSPSSGLTYVTAVVAL